MNRFYIPEHCSLGLTVLGITFQLRWINAGTISKEVELRDIHVISRFITRICMNCENTSKCLLSNSQGSFVPRKFFQIGDHELAEFARYPPAIASSLVDYASVPVLPHAPAIIQVQSCK